MRELDSIIAPMREQLGKLESIIAFPGVMTALEKALHPDGKADTAGHTAMFQSLMAVRDHLAGK